MYLFRIFLQIFRHGDRAPSFKYKTDPFANDFPEGKNELTKVLTKIKYCI